MSFKKIIKLALMIGLAKKLWDLSQRRQIKHFFRAKLIPFFRRHQNICFSSLPIWHNNRDLSEHEKAEFWNQIREFLQKRKISVGIFLCTIIAGSGMTIFQETKPLFASLTDISTPEEIAKEIEEAKTMREKMEKKEAVESPDNIEIITNSIYRPGGTKIIQIKAHTPEVMGGEIKLTSTLRELAEITPQVLKPKDFKNGRAYVRLETESHQTFRIIASGVFGEKMSQPLEAQVFEDVPPQHPYAKAIKYLKDSDIAQGFDNGDFQPDWDLYRVEAVTMLLRANRIKLASKNTTFEDVSADVWFAPYVATAQAEGLIDNPSEDKKVFGPTENLDKAAFLKMAVHAFGFQPPDVEEAPFRDVPQNAWFAPYFVFAKQHDIFSDIFAHPSDKITRGEAAQIIFQMAQINTL